MAPTRCRSSSDLREAELRSTITPPGEHIAAWWDRFSKSATNAWDDGTQLEYACLKKVWQLSWSQEDGASSVLPYDESIHRLGNLGNKTAISVHLYGPRLGELDGRDYDPSRDYVCDRREI